MNEENGEAGSKQYAKDQEKEIQIISQQWKQTEALDTRSR